MNLEKTIENIKKICDSYIDPELAIKYINKDYLFSTDKNDYIFINCGLLIPAPLFNEIDIFTDKKYTISLTAQEFVKYQNMREKYFGILIKEEEYILGVIDLCDCQIDSGFTPLEKSDDLLYKKIEKIATNLIM